MITRTKGNTNHELDFKANNFKQANANNLQQTKAKDLRQVKTNNLMQTNVNDLQKTSDSFFLRSFKFLIKRKLSRTITLREFLEKYENEILIPSNLAIGTKNVYLSAGRMIKIHPICNKIISNISSLTITDFFNDRMNGFDSISGNFVKGCRRDNLTNTLALLNRIFSYACGEVKILKENPMTGFKIPAGIEVRNIFDESYNSNYQNSFLTKAQYELLVSTLKNINSPALLPVQIAYFTGLRLGEVTALTWQDINFKDKSIVVRRSIVLNRVYENTLEFTTTKNKQIRKVYFGEKLERILTDAFNQQKLNKLMLGNLYYRNYYCMQTLDNQPHYPLFTFKDSCAVDENYRPIELVCINNDGRFVSRRNISSICYRLKSKVPELSNFTFHKLRHSYTTNLINSGVDPKTVQELLGHSDVSTTMNIYAHSEDEKKRKAAELLG